MNRQRIAAIAIAIALLGSVAGYFFMNKVGKSTDDPNDGQLTDVLRPQPISYTLVNTTPKDSSFYTQGLIIYKGQMYISAGQWGESRIMKMDIATGKPTSKIVSLDKKLFGEGITILRDTLYQLTWKDQKVFVYTAKDLNKVKEHNLNTEGWGITTDGQYLIVSAGNSKLYYYEPSTFSLVKTLDITNAGQLQPNLNELEYINGFIYANNYNYNNIFKINPADGKIVGTIDLTELVNKAQANYKKAEVLNGIAYDSATGKVFVTGKYWKDMYEIEFSK